MTRRNRRLLCWWLALFSLLLCVSPRILILSYWRLTHPAHTMIAGRKISVPLRWMLVSADDPARLSTFSSLFPLGDKKSSDVVIESTPDDRKSESSDAWLADIERYLALKGYSDVKRRFLSGGDLVCVASTKQELQFASCRLARTITMTYAGTPSLMESAIGILTASK